jgi:enamine deaminase RidA (YjgF/YER057c/UK114 family)
MSQGLVADGVLYISGQVSAAEGLAAQATEAWSKIVARTEVAGGVAADISNLTIYVCSESPAPERTTVMAAWAVLEPLVIDAVGFPPPAVTIVQVVGLAYPELRIEIQAIAHLGSSSA